MATAVEKIRERARKNGIELSDSETEKEQKTTSAAELIRERAEKNFVTITVDGDTISARRKAVIPSSYHLLPGTELGAHGRIAERPSRMGETRREGTKTGNGETIPGARWDPSKRQVNATVRSADEIRADIAAVEEEIRDANHGSIKSDFGVLFGGHTNSMVPAERIAQLNENRKRLRQELAANRSALRNNADFAEKNQADSGFAAMTDDDMYRLVNYPEEYSASGNSLKNIPSAERALINSPTQGIEVNETLKNLIDPIYAAVYNDAQYIRNMTDEERQNYNYLYKTEGRTAADEYLELIRDGLTARYTEETNAKVKEFAEEHPVLSSAYTVATLPAKGASALGGLLGTYLSGQELDRNGSYNVLANASSEIRRTVSDRIEENWGKFGSAAYNIGMSMADFLAMGVIGKGSQIPLAILGSNAAADMTITALDRGVSDGKAIALGLIAGFAEAAAEKVGIDNLFKSQYWSKNSLRYILQNAFGEFLEEGGTSLVNSLADILISRDKSEWQQSINAYTEQGFTDTEAFWRTFKDTAGMIGLDALGGAISGGLMAGGGVAIAKTGQAAVNRENIRAAQETWRGARKVSDYNRAADTADYIDKNGFAEADAGEPVIISRPTATTEGEEFEIGREVLRDQLMTIEQQERADMIDNADDLTATALKYDATPNQLSQARALSELTGYSVEFFRQKNPNGTVKNGFYDPDSNKIYLNVNSKRTIATTFGHELTHTLEGTSAYESLRDHVFGILRSSGKDIDAERQKTADIYKKAGKDFRDTDQLDADIVAEYAGKVLFNDADAIREVYRDSPSAARKIASAIDRMLIRATGMQDTTAKAFLERASAMYQRADEAAENSEKEINRRLDEQETVQATGGESVPQTGSPVQQTAPQGQPAEAAAAPGSSGTAISASEEQRKPAETAGQRHTVPQTGGTVSGGAETRPAETEVQEGARTSMDESDAADRMLEDLNRRYENGEISDEEYDEAYELIEEARLTGRGIESSADVVDNVEGKIPRGIRKLGGKLGIRPKGERYSISEDDVRERVANGRPVEAADEVQWSISNDGVYMDAAERENGQTQYVPYNVLARARSDREEIRRIFTDPALRESLNLPPDNIGNTYIPNGSYDGTEENTTVCIRSMAADALMDAVAEHLGRPLTVEDTITVSQEYWQYTDQPECLYCYVAMDRKAYREFLGSYLEQRNNALADLRSGMDRGEAYDRYLDGRKDTKPQRERFRMWERALQNGTGMITEADLASEKSMQDAAARSPELAAQINDARKYAQGASWAKKRIGYTAYNNHILKWTPDRIRKLNSQFGLRLYSFSDFSPAFILENMQMITDASVRGLKMLGYTKDINFAKIFAPSGININISTFAYEGVNGEMVQDGMQGADWAEAQALRDRYGNVGITFVAVNDAQVEWALAQDWVDVVIPFHLVRTGAKVAEHFGWKNYTQMSSDVKTKDWAKGDKKSIYPSEHQNDRERYFEALRKNHLEPRFREWADNPNYMKLVNETRRSAGETPAVQPVFDVDAAKAAIEEMRRRGGYYVPVGKTDENMRDIAGEIAEKIRADEGDVKWSVSAEENAQPTENGMLVDRYAGMEGQNNVFRNLLMRQNQRMVDAIVAHRGQTKTEKFREWFGKSTVINNDGEPMVVFRGTSATTAELDHNDKPIWFSNNVMYAKAYSDEVTLQDKFRMSSRIFGGAEMKIIPAYLRAVNPADFGDTDGSFVEKLSELSRNLMIPEDELREVWDKTGRQETVWKTLHTTEMKNLLSSYGYDSVKAVEYGVDTWGVFSSSQVKSAVANNGKFNPNRSDIRYSISEEEDRRYIDAARSGDTESAQKMVDKAAKAAGYDVDAFHGTDGGDFYVFDWDKTQSTDGGFFGRGHYFTKYRGVAQQYGERVVEAKLNLGKTFVWSEEVNTYNGIRPPEILSRNIVSRINLAKHFPDIFADQKMSYFEYDEKRGEYVDKNIKWENLEDVINAISDDLILRPYADGTFKWHTEGRFWEVPVGETYSSEQEAEDGKFFAAINALKEKYDGLFDTMSLDDQTTYTQAYGSEITEILKKNGYDSAMDTPDGGEIVVFDSSRIKSAAPITYDESGKIIPLSERFKRDNSDIRYSVSEDEDTTPYGGLPVKAQNRVRDLERKFGVALDKMFGLGMTYKSPDFRQFLADNVRPLVNTYLENGSIPQEESDALFRSFYNPLSGTDEDLQKQEFYAAFEQMEEGLREVARYAASGKQQADSAAEEPSPLPTTEEAEELFRAQRDARREMDKVMYKLMLRPEDEVKVGELLRGTTSADQIDPETHNKQSILEAYRVQKAFRDADAAVSVYKKRLKAELYRHVDAYLGNIAQWKDKAVPLLYQRETMERNIRDIIPDKAEADAFIAEFITPVHHAEAERQRFLAEYRDRIRNLGLSSKVQKGNENSEAYAVQLLGEAQDNIRILSLSGRLDQKRDGHTLTEWQLLVDNFWDANPNMDRAKIERAIGEFRQIYNELLPKINEVRIRNGYAPVAFRQGYFPHFTATSEDTVLAKLLRPFGIQFNADALPTSINGLTADFKPGITYFQFGNERLGFETTYDALQGYEMYLNAASDVIYHTDNIQKLRALATRIRYLTGDEGVKQQIDKVRNNDTLDEAEKQVQLEEIYRKGRYRMSNFVVAADEYTNALANKKSRFDRGVEELFGRPAYSVMKALESRVASNMIAGNIGSALTNIIPLNQANAILGNVNVLKGMYQTVRGMAQDDGFAAASDFLTNRRGSDSLVRTTSQKVSDMASIPMNLIDNFVSESIVRAAYMKNLAGGMGEDLALQHADALAASIMADRSKGALPLLFNARNPLMKLFTQFQVEVNNEYSVIFKDIPELAKADAKTRAGAAARIAGMLFKYLVGAWLFNDLYEKLFGRRAALDPVEMLNNAVGGISGYQVPNVVNLAGEAITGDLTAEDFAVEAQDPGKVLQTLGTEAAESLPFIGGVLGGGRVPIQSALPDLANLTMAATSDTWTGKKKALTAFEELSKPAAYLLPPFGGGQIQKMLRGGAAALQGGVYGVEGDEDGGTYLKYPVYDDWLNAIVFGTTYTEGGREWVDSGFKSLSVKQTTAYQEMKEYGADDRTAYDLIQAYKSVPDGEGRSAAQRDVIRSAGIPGGAKYAAYYNLGASDARRALMDAITDTEPEANLGEAAEVLMDISDIRTGKTAGVCDLLAQSGLTEETKKLIYLQEVSDQRGDDIAAAEWAGITFDEYLDAHGAYSAIGNKDLTKTEQALEFARYVDGTNLSDTQKDTVREIFKFYSQIPVQAKSYNELRDIGISDDYAAKLVRAVDALEPLPGEKSVSSIQKARVVVDTISDADDRLAALGTVLSDSQFRKVSIAADAGLDPEVWVAFREILPEFDSDANGSYTQEEMEDAIRAFSNGSNYGTTLMKAARNLSRDEMAILWQIGGSWKSTNNPFSKTTGKYVKDLLDAEKKG